MTTSSAITIASHAMMFLYVRVPQSKIMYNEMEFKASNSSFLIKRYSDIANQVRAFKIMFQFLTDNSISASISGEKIDQNVFRCDVAMALFSDLTRWTHKGNQISLIWSYFGSSRISIQLARFPFNFIYTPMKVMAQISDGNSSSTISLQNIDN